MLLGLDMDGLIVKWLLWRKEREEREEALRKVLALGKDSS